MKESLRSICFAKFAKLKKVGDIVTIDSDSDSIRPYMNEYQKQCGFILTLKRIDGQTFVIAVKGK